MEGKHKLHRQQEFNFLWFAFVRDNGEVVRQVSCRELTFCSAQGLPFSSISSLLALPVIWLLWLLLWKNGFRNPFFPVFSIICRHVQKYFKVRFYLIVWESWTSKYSLLEYVRRMIWFGWEKHLIKYAQIQLLSCMLMSVICRKLLIAGLWSIYFICNCSYIYYLNTSMCISKEKVYINEYCMTNQKQAS